MKDKAVGIDLLAISAFSDEQMVRMCFAITSSVTQAA